MRGSTTVPLLVSEKPMLDALVEDELLAELCVFLDSVGNVDDHEKLATEDELVSSEKDNDDPPFSALVTINLHGPVTSHSV